MDGYRCNKLLFVKINVEHLKLVDAETVKRPREPIV
jgi:hypothetical protein